jgi:hypothetical protein
MPVIPAMAGSLKIIVQEDHGPGQPGQKVRTCLQNNQGFYCHGEHFSILTFSVKTHFKREHLVTSKY